MQKLSVYWPVKPLIVTQAFGIFNPAYKQFGFTNHNGLDLLVVDGQEAYAMFNGLVSEVGENSGAGKYVKIRTVGPVEVGNDSGVVCLMYMHGKEILVKEGQSVAPGDLLMRCDNTGFSTGHHLHVSAFFVDSNGKKLRRGVPQTDYCFDWVPYCNRFYSEDAKTVLSLYMRVIELLRALQKL